MEREARQDGKPLERARWAVGQLRHLYKQMLNGDVADTKEAARGLLGPAIETLESNNDSAQRVLDKVRNDTLEDARRAACEYVEGEICDGDRRDGTYCDYCTQIRALKYSSAQRNPQGSSTGGGA